MKYKTHLSIIVILLSCTVLLAKPDLNQCLKNINNYKIGDTKKGLHEFRLAAYKGINDPKVKQAHEQLLLKFVTSDASIHARRYVCRILGHIGGRKSIIAMTPLALKEGHIAEDALYVLEQIPLSEARLALEKNLSKAKGNKRIAFILAIGAKGSSESLPILKKSLQNASESEQKAIVFALGTIATAEALSILKSEKFSDALNDYVMQIKIQIADKLIEQGDIKNAQPVFQAAYKEKLPFKAAGYSGLLKCSPKRSSQLLIEGVTNTDNQIFLIGVTQLGSSFPSKFITDSVVNILSKLDDNRKTLVIKALAKRGDKTAKAGIKKIYPKSSSRVKTEILLALGALGDASDVEFLLSILLKENSKEAFNALCSIPDKSTGKQITKLIKKNDWQITIKLFEILIARNDPEAVTVGWDYSTSKNSEIQSKAVRMLGKTAPLSQFSQVIEIFTAKKCKNKQKARIAVWEMLRRFIDNDKAVTIVKNAIAKADNEEKQALESMLAKVKSLKEQKTPTGKKEKKGKRKPPKKSKKSPLKKTKSKVSIEQMLEMDTEDSWKNTAPNGYKRIVYLDCGKKASASGSGANIKIISGKDYDFAPGDHRITTVAFGKTVGIDISGLKNTEKYVLGISWWDGDNKLRKQSIAFQKGGSQKWVTVMPESPPLSYYANGPTWARYYLPVPKDMYAAGNMKINIKKHEGANAVISEIFLLQKNDSAPKKKILIVTGDDSPGHRWRLTQIEFVNMLRKHKNLEVTVSETPYILGSSLLSHYDGVMIHFKNYDDRLLLGPEIQKNFEQFVANGGGLCVAHFGCGAFQNWNGFVKVAGRIWNPKFRGHDKYGLFEVRIIDKNHPITKGMDNFKTTDELYTCLDGQTPIHILCESTSVKDKKNYPMAFTAKFHKGRVFHCALGHDVKALQAEGTRELFRKGIAWTVGLLENSK